MTAAMIVILLAAAFTMASAIAVYERLLAQVRAERDEAVADCELFSELLIDSAVQRHPSQFGGANLRVVR